MADLTLQQAYQRAVATNYLYSRNIKRWQFLMDSFNGGEDYRNGAYLQRYALETDKEYQVRLENTPLDNQVRGIVSLYISFLFREKPQRDLGLIEDHPMVEDIFDDADLDGRSLDAFMKDVAIWTSVFGHVWICVAKPNVGATTLADELAQGVRPYLSMYIPPAVTDWTWERQPNGSYALSYIKLLEEVNDTESRVVEWTKETITTTVINTRENKATAQSQEINELGRLPFICAYASRGAVRGIGSSLIDDIADQQRMIYNELSEVYDSIRLDTHPSLVATEQVNAQGAAAGQVITMPENMDPALKPYVLQFQGGQISSIYDSINNRVKMIEAMANIGTVRANQTTAMSAIAMETEFQLLNARLSSIADNLELAEEQIWREISEYLGVAWQGEIVYPGNFALHNVDNELDQLTKMKSLSLLPEIQTAIDAKVADLLDIELTIDLEPVPNTTADAMMEIQGEGTVNGCPIPMTDKQMNIDNHLECVKEANLGPASVTNPGVFWIQRADRLGITEQESRSQTCANCAYYVNNSAIQNCWNENMAAGNIPKATDINATWENVPNPAGYCVEWDITCTPTRTCDTWAPGGPKVD